MQVLMIEDNKTDFLLVSRLVAKIDDVEIEWRDTVEKGLAFIDTHQVDVVMLDLTLPDGYGMQVMSQIKTRFPTLPIIILSGNNATDLALEAVRHGAQDYLVKGRVDDHLLSRSLRYAVERKRAEAALAAERNLLRTLIDSIPDYIYVKDTQGRYVTVNNAVLSAVGLTSFEQILGKNDFDFLPTEIAQSFHADEQQVMTSGEALINKEEESVHPNTSEKLWFSTTKVPLKNERGIINGLLGISWNITQRKQMEETLKARMQEEHEFQNYLKTLHEITVELTSISNLDEFYRRAVEFGLQRLGFDRLGLMLYDQEQNLAIGTYGTDAQGKLVAEHDLHLEPSDLTRILLRSLQKEDRFALDEQAQLFSNLKPIGIGWNAAAVLWNGTEKLGWLSADNAVQHLPIKQSQLDILGLYALTLGTLLAQKRTQIAVQESERRLHLLAQNSPDIIYILSLTEQRATYLNRSQFLGYSQTEIEVSESLTKAIHPDDQEQVMAHWREIITNGEANRTSMIEYRMQDKSGRWCWIQSRETIFASTADEEPTQILVTLTDITERKQAEERLTQERDLLHTLINGSPDYIFIKDTEGHYILSNKAHAQLTGLSSDDLAGKTVFDVFSHEVATEFEAEDKQILQSGKSVINVERRIAGQDGKFQTVLSSKIPLWGQDGQITSLIGISRDITERKQLESQAVELAEERGRIKLLQRFIDDMSHDFRTPLAAINSNLYLIQKNNDPSKKQIYAARAQQQILRIDKILEELLQMQRLDSDETDFQFNRTEINTFLAQLIGEYEQTGVPKQITVEFIPDIDRYYVPIDVVEFARVIIKLIDNAVAYSPEGGKIIFQAKKENNSLIVSVQDAGIGIAKNDLPHIFERFYRADQARSTTTGGSGLGLSIVQKIVEAHHGTIEVESTLSQGSKFSIKLPLD